MLRTGDLVYDKSEPRHVGVVRCVSVNRRTATVRWIESGWLSCRLPWAALRIVSLRRYRDEVEQLKRRLRRGI